MAAAGLDDDAPNLRIELQEMPRQEQRERLGLEAEVLVRDDCVMVPLYHQGFHCVATGRMARFTRRMP